MHGPSVNPWVILVGAIAAGGIIVGAVQWQRWQRRQRGVRPPNTRNLLRPPGHHLSLRLEDYEQKLLSFMTIAVGSGAALAALGTLLVSPLLNSDVRTWIAANGWQHSLFSRPLLPAVLSSTLMLLGCLSGLIFGVERSLDCIKEMRKLYLGLRGEQAVAEALLEAAEYAYRAFHDFPGEKSPNGKPWNIDHVVVGPGGVFAIETKTRSKQKAPAGKQDHKVQYDGIALQFPWEDKPSTEYVEQAKRNAKSLEGYLGKATGMKVPVKPVLALPGWYVDTTTKPTTHVVRAMPETALATHLREQPRELSAEKIQQIAFQLDQKCRDVEF